MTRHRLDAWTESADPRRCLRGELLHGAHDGGANPAVGKEARPLLQLAQGCDPSPPEPSSQARGGQVQSPLPFPQSSLQPPPSKRLGASWAGGPPVDSIAWLPKPHITDVPPLNGTAGSTELKVKAAAFV